MCCAVVLGGVLGNDGNLMYMLVLLCSSFISIVCFDGGRLVARFRAD